MPDISKRSFDEILEDNKLLASVYVPEWKPLDDKDLGVALLKIFSHMQEEIYNRLNRVPDRSFASFLDMLGVKLMPAQPARASVTFYLAEGLLDSVLISARTRVATAETESHGALIYETTKNFSATRATIDQIYSVNPDKDELYCHSEDFEARRPFRAYEGENIQKHILYMGHSKLFKLKKPRPIVLGISLEGNASLEDLRSWQWSHGEGGRFSTITVSKDSELANGYLITLMPEGVIKESSVSGTSSLWIACSPGPVTQRSNLPTIREICIQSVSPGSSLDPDMGFYNFLPLELSQKFYPFGRQPRLYDSFYLSSQEAFSKADATVIITFRREGNADDVKPTDDVEISWEYWNGLRWQALDIDDDENTVLNFKLNSTEGGYIKFKRPGDMAENEVNGVMGYWIWARLVNGGYGSERIDPYNPPGSSNTFYHVTPNFSPPWVNSVKISYSLTEKSFLEHCLTYNNREFRDVTAVSHGPGFRPFIPIQEKVPTLYIGFKEPLRKGNLSIFFSMIDEQRSSRITPEVIWSYWTSAPDLMKMENNGHNELTFASIDGLGVGTELLLEETFQDESASEVGSIYNIYEKIADLSRKERIVELDRKLDHIYTAKSRVLRRSRLDVLDNTEHLSKSETLELLGPSDHQIATRFGETRYWLMAAIAPEDAATFIGIYPNTVWVEQVESISDEILGSSEGEKDSSYSFVKRPVISPDVWVREGATVSDPDLDIQEVKDSSGKVIDAWVRWNQVDDFFNSGPRSRHYVMDGASGELMFGDGINGMIPPIGRDNIKASYKSGGGSEGNVAAGEINVVKTPVSGIDQVVNHLPAEGGSDTESMDSVFERGPYIIRTMDRAVTAEDFERLAKASSSYVARAKSLIDGSKLKVIVIPRGKEDRPMPSSGLLKIVKGYLLERSLSTISSENLEVTAPAYKEIRIKVNVIPKSIDLAVPLEKEIQNKLRDYLHPLTGGPSGAGWEFGRPVRISDVYSLLEDLDGVDHVESLSLELNDSPEDVEMMDDEVACSGNHTVNIRLGDKP